MIRPPGTTSTLHLMEVIKWRSEIDDPQLNDIELLESAFELLREYAEGEKRYSGRYLRTWNSYR